MNILVSGASGLIGRALVPFLNAKGHIVKTLIRTRAQYPSQIEWDPPDSGPAPKSLEDIEAVIHLAGESLFASRWSQAKKRAIRDSRTVGTRLLTESFAGMKTPPKVLLSASAIGYYGHRGQESLSEDSLPGTGFLADLCKAWEAATAPAENLGVRVVHLRTGLVLSPKNGALAKMLWPFRLGLGGTLGPGTQYWSWITIEDVVAAIEYLLQNESINGPVNLVAPGPVTNAEFTKALGQRLGRPTVLPLPAFLLRLALGQMADELLLSSARVNPTVLNQTGYRFQHPTLDVALRALLSPSL